MAGGVVEAGTLFGGWGVGEDRLGVRDEGGGGVDVVGDAIATVVVEMGGPGGGGMMFE